MSHRVSLLTASLALLTLNLHVLAESRFGRPIVKTANPKDYVFFKLDDNTYPVLSSERYAVACLVYRGTQRYYVELGVMNRSTQDLVVEKDFVSFIKPGYTVLRISALAAALEVAADASGTFVPTPPPPVPTKTDVDVTATTYGNQTQITGTATTGPDPGAQAGANLGNAIGNALAARRFYNSQSREKTFATFLYTFAQETVKPLIKPDQGQIIVCTFEQIKRKKAPFEIRIRLGDETFTFRFKE